MERGGLHQPSFNFQNWLRAASVRGQPYPGRPRSFEQATRITNSSYGERARLTKRAGVLRFRQIELPRSRAVSSI